MFFAVSKTVPTVAISIAVVILAVMIVWAIFAGRGGDK